MADYLVVLLVESSDMTQAEEQGGKFEGVVGKIHSMEPVRNCPKFENADRIFLRNTATAVFVACFSFIPYGVLSGFRAGQSSTAQRAWTMSWLVGGIVFDLFLQFRSCLKETGLRCRSLKLIPCVVSQLTIVLHYTASPNEASYEGSHHGPIEPVQLQ